MIFHNYRQREKGAVNSDGFTLVELLVVVAIIVALIAILLPALESAIDRGHRAACANNQRQLFVALVSYGSDNNGWSPSTSWYGGGLSHLNGSMGNGVSTPHEGTSCYNWLRYYCQILIVPGYYGMGVILRLDNRPADGCLLFCPSAGLREDVTWASTYYYNQYSYLLTGLGKAGVEDWPNLTGVETIRQWGSTRLNVMDGEGYPIAIFHERFYTQGYDQYNSHRGQGVNITDQTGSVQWSKPSELAPPDGNQGGWAKSKYWLPPVWGATDPNGYSGPPGSNKNMSRQYGYKKGGT